MTSVLTEICDWAVNKLQYWEQIALDKILSGVQFKDLDYEELLQYLLEDADLAEQEEARPELHFPNRTDDKHKPRAPVRLLRISNLRNVNALVPDQTLTFCPSLTAIYGGNGSGKSGFARVLGCAGFTRGDKEVLPDVTQPIDEELMIVADIEIADRGSHKSIHYEIGGPCSELASFYVFDSTSVQAHLTESNAFSFSPAGLSRLTQLADVTDSVRDRLKGRIEEYSQEHQFDTLFQGNSEVSELVASLGPDTDIDELCQLAALSPEEKEQIDKLDLKIAQLKTQDIPSQIEELKQRIEDLDSLIGRLREAQKGLSDQKSEEIRAAVKTCVDCQKAAQQMSIGQFKSEHFAKIGSDVWYKFIAAAKALADAEEGREKAYPQHGDRCLLCRQPLTSDAINLLLRLWEFLEGEAQRSLEEAQDCLKEKQEAVGVINLDFFGDENVSHRYLQEYKAEMLQKVETFLSACRRRRETMQEITTSPSRDVELAPLPSNGIPELESIIKSLRSDLEKLEAKDPTEEITGLEQQKLRLEHRVLLGEHLSEIEKYVQKRKWAQRADRVGGSTRRITRKYNQLFNRLVTERYIELFEQTLDKLGRPLEVSIDTRGRKGEVYKQIALKSHPSVEEAPPDKVLSEGEKRAVALADFLTEVALDTTSSGVILDDPVTSLDLEWREVIASILASEADRRQVIVFTHDLPFLYHLKKHSQEEGVDIATHWIKRGTDGKPGYVFLDNSPALEREYRSSKRAREIYKKAKDAPAEEQEALLREGFGALRTSYEAFIIFRLFNEVIMRFDERISFGRLKDIVWDEQIAEDVIDACERLSRYIEGHLHSDAFAAQKPTPKTLIEEIQAFDALNKRLKDLKKQR
jgi:archaellum component FlaC